MTLLDRILSKPTRRRLAAAIKRWTLRPRLGKVNFGDLRRLTPISNDWGYDRGRPVDRFYIESFLADHRGDVRGHVLEVGTDVYTRQFGGDEVTESDVLHVSDHAPGVTIVADLSRPNDLPSDAFDCVILTQTLQFIYDVPATLATVHRVLKPGGVLLATVPGIAQISRADMERWGDFWRFTSLALRRLVHDAFGPDTATVTAFGNVLAATAFLQGIAADELLPEELTYDDPDHELLIAVRAAKSRAP